MVVGCCVVGMLAVIALGVRSLTTARPHHPAAVPVTRPTSPPAAVVVTAPRTTTTVPPPYRPPAVKPLVSPARPGEGEWVPLDTWNPGPPAVLTTTFRPDPTQPAVTAYAAWVRTSSAQLALYPGYKGPGPTASAVDRGPEMVPEAARPELLATFNSGFYEADAAGGFYTHGTLYFPMVNGLGTVVAYRNGRVDVVDWTGGPRPGADVVMARQNLPLIVDDGRPNPALDTSFRWGLTLHGVPAVWRTALGIDRSGNLLYVAAPSQTAPSLAHVLIELGAVRGIQLDINPEWPIFSTYGGPGALAPSLFVPNPNQTPQRFLYQSTKDFFAVYRRSVAAAGPPW
jgi:hypothetical protein